MICSSVHIAPTDIDNDALYEIGMLLNLRRSINMSMYKDNYVKRRIAIRMRATQSENAPHYCHILRSSDEELDLLVKALTIHVSQFYRNASMFEALRLNILPHIFRTASENGDRGITILCLGSACGEEPYSLAILLKEHFSRELRQSAVTITGLDIDAGSIAIAMQGKYPEDRLRDLPPNLKEQYFREWGGKYTLVPAITDMVNFELANIIDLSERHPADLIFCRNTLIYFARSDQEKILHNISGILPDGGILVLGKSETIVGPARRCFETISMEERIYRKKQLSV